MYQESPFGFDCGFLIGSFLRCGDGWRLWRNQHTLQAIVDVFLSPCKYFVGNYGQSCFRNGLGDLGWARMSPSLDDFFRF